MLFLVICFCLCYNSTINWGEKRMSFYEKMHLVCMAIPAGKVATYGQIALLCGKPKNSRQVGYGLKNDLAGSDVPAFRIVNGKGELSGAFHFQIPDLQRKLLEDDGIEVFWNGNNWCVDLKKFGWKSTAEDAENFQRQFENTKQQEDMIYEPTTTKDGG